MKEAAIEFRITILSKDHVKKLEARLRKHKTLPKNIRRTNSEDETDLVGANDVKQLGLKKSKDELFENSSLLSNLLLFLKTIL